MKNKTFRAALLCLLAVCLLLSACSSRSEEAEVAEEPAPTEAPIPTENPNPVVAEVPETTPATPIPTSEPAVEVPVVDETGKILNPLTGEPMSEDISTLRPFTVMFNNHTGALPQCGIGSADIIYEAPEEGITRMMGVFSQLPDCERFGSIRSTRPYHVDVSLSYDSIFVHWGRSDMAANLIWNTGIDDIELNEEGNSYAYRDYSHGSGATEHTGFIKLENLKKFLSDNNYRTTHSGEHGYGFAFTDKPELNGGTAQKITVYFGGKETTFTYDEAKGGYTMSQYGGTAYVDGDTGEAPVFRNVLVLRTTIYNETDIASIVLTDTSDVGVLCCDGARGDISWSRGGYSDNFHYFGADGSDMEMGVGKTYVCIVSHNDNVYFE